MSVVQRRDFRSQEISVLKTGRTDRTNVSVPPTAAIASVEAAGIEPASRCISMRTSTGVVDSLRFAISAPHRHGAPMASQKHFLAATVPGVDRDDLDLATDFWASPAKARSQKQPVLGC